MQQQEQNDLFGEAMTRAVDWQRKCHALTNGLQFETSPRKRVAVAFQHLSFEHHDGILDLLQRGFHGPAFALYRPQFDAYTRGLWYRTRADEGRIAALLNDEKQPPELKHLIPDLEKSGIDSEGHLRRLKGSMYSRLCDFTHGGTAQIVSRLQQNEIAPAYDTRHLAWLTSSSSKLSYLACVEMAKAIESEELVVAAHRACSSVYPMWKEAVDKAN